ncbi:MAG: phospholipase D-like domain-containing protein [Vicinamibacteraceae bacterium]
MARIRGWLWWSLPWTVACTWALATDRWWWALGTGLMAALSQAIALRDPGLTFAVDHQMAVESEAFLDSMVGSTGIPLLAGNAIDILNNGDEFYPSMLEAIRGARRSITIEAYIYWRGDIGLEVAHAIADRGRAGVPVKLLLDAVGSATIGTEILEILAAGGCQLGWFNPIGWYTLDRFNYRTHRKSLVVDGCIAFTGGAGIADHWQGSAQDPEHWRDMQVRIEGPGAVPLQTGFAQNWLRTTGEMVSGPEFFPPPVDAGDVDVLTVLSSPSAGASPVRTMYYLAIAAARRSIQIANPYFVPDQVAIDAIKAARARGVAVTVIVSGIRNDNWLARHNSVRLFGPLLEAGVEIYEYNRTMLHQKTMVVDDAWATIGTANFDNRSFAFNEESNVSLHDRGCVKRLIAVFAEDLAVSDRVTLDRWRRRGVIAQAQELVAALFEDQV